MLIKNERTKIGKIMEKKPIPPAYIAITSPSEESRPKESKEASNTAIGKVNITIVGRDRRKIFIAKYGEI